MKQRIQRLCLSVFFYYYYMGYITLLVFCFELLVLYVVLGDLFSVWIVFMILCLCYPPLVLYVMSDIKYVC